jgi:serine/threonine-protein kinase
MAQPLATGSLLNGRYRIERELGRGGIGVVFLARDERLHQMPVVIKFLLDASGRNAWLTKKFQHEAEALTRINHPGVVRVMDRDEADDGRPFFVMEFIEGHSLRPVMTPTGMDLAMTARLVRQIGHALTAAHTQGVFHRDLKPENIMLQTLPSGEQQVKLIDFGIAKLLDAQSGAATEVAVLAGSQAYISPEQLLSQPITAATDIYTFAIITYEMLTGRLPFQVSAPNVFLATQQLVKLQQSHAFIKPCSLRPDLPVAAEILLLNAMQFDAARRPQNAQVFADDLAAALAGQISAMRERPTAAIAPPPPPPRTPATAPVPPAVATTPDESRTFTNAPVAQPEPKGRNRAVFAGIGLVVLLAAGLAYAVLTRKPVPDPDPVVRPELTLRYSVTMQKDPRRYPGSQPFQLPGEVIFSPGDRVRFTFSSPQPGHLYILNESPATQGAATSFNILFPSPTSNQNSSQLAAGRPVTIPDIGDGFVLDEESGTEKLWIVWTAASVAELEALKQWANPRDKGEIHDAAQIASLRAFLTTHAAFAPDSQKDDATKQTTLKTRNDMMLKLVKLEHH